MPPAGRRRLVRLAIAVAGILAAVAVAAAVWVAASWSDPPVRAGLVSWTPTVDGVVEVTMDVRRRPGLPVTCEVSAVDRRRAVVGTATLRLPAGSERLVRSTLRVPVDGEAVAARLVGCRVPAVP